MGLRNGTISCPPDNPLMFTTVFSPTCPNFNFIIGRLGMTGRSVGGQLEIVGSHDTCASVGLGAN